MPKLLLSGPTGYRESGWGAAHYSYGLVMDSMTAMLRGAGVPHQELRHPEALSWLHSESDGAPDVWHLAFQPPDSARLVWGARNVCVFAWEFDRLVQRHEGSDLAYYSRWLRRFDDVWTLSRHAAQVLQEDGLDRVQVMPAPIDTHFWAPVEEVAAGAGGGRIPDSLAKTPAVPLSHRSGLLGEVGPAPRTVSLGSILSASSSGGTFLYIANPDDYRKNLEPLVAAFEAHVDAFPDSVLLLKLTTRKTPEELRATTFPTVFRNSPRLQSSNIFVIAERLDEDDLRSLMLSCDFYVSPSHAEGQNLPLLEAMSMGRVVISPDHTSMSDYVTSANAIVLPSREVEVSPESHPHPAFWGLRWFDIGVREITEALDEARRLDSDKRQAYGSSARSDVIARFGHAASQQRLIALLAGKEQAL